MWPINPADLRVYIHVVNTSNVSGTPSCFVYAQDPDDNYQGFNTVQHDSALKPGGEWNFADDLTITKQGSQYVTQVSVKCDDQSQ